MLISFSPQCREDTLEVIKQGDILTINGVVFDFTELEEGSELPESAITGTTFIEGPISRVNGEIQIKLRLPYSFAAGHVEDPEPIQVTANGKIELPILNRPPMIELLEEEEEEEVTDVTN